jgi:hypothetical protein
VKYFRFVERQHVFFSRSYGKMNQVMGKKFIVFQQLSPLTDLGVLVAAQDGKEFTKAQNDKQGSKDLFTFQGKKGTKCQGRRGP